MQIEKQGSSFILTHVDMQFDKHHLLKVLSFLQCILLVSLSKSHVAVREWNYMWILNSISLMNVSIFRPVPCCFYYCSSIILLKIRHGDFYSNVLIVWAILGLSC